MSRWLCQLSYGPVIVSIFLLSIKYSHGVKKKRTGFAEPRKANDARSVLLFVYLLLYHNKL
jgi:hypothetical protein